MSPRFCKRRVPYPTFGGWGIIPRRNPAERKLPALAASVRVVLDKRACQELCSALNKRRMSPASVSGGVHFRLSAVG